MPAPAAPDSERADRVNESSAELREELQRAVFPRYQVGPEIGVGGMAFVFQGYDTSERRAVAFKALKRQYASLLGPTRFLREIRLLSQLHHPGILPLLDSGHTDRLFWYAMPLVEGETLQTLLEREPQLPVERVGQIVAQVAEALDYAHDAGVVHRDIKPSNLFICGDRALLSDFGIAKDLSPPEEESTTSTGLIVGTALYISPEQADGHHHADRRADVYSLGCVAYQMVAGEPPFTGPTTQAVIARHRATPAPSARVVRPELPLGVDVVIRKALAKSPADRYQSAGEFAEALTDPRKLAAAAQEARGEGVSPVRLGILAAGLIVALAVATLLWPGRALDATRVVVFPMGVSPPEATSEGAGIEVALMIGSALEFTDPFQWIDGLPLLDPALRGDGSHLTARAARRIARAAGARWFVDGTVVRRRDSVTVVVRLNDAAGDSVVGRTSATRLAPEAAQAGLAAINGLLPSLLSPGQKVADLSALADRHPAAVASWLQGEREYRRFNFAAALEFERKAVAADSALAVAALRGAQAASWLDELSEAEALSGAALRHAALLPPRMADFARGLDAYLGGRADSAVHSLRLALARSPDWTEAHMTLGEVYYHLLPAFPGPPDSLAMAEFALAASDTGFAPPRFHLAELAIRRMTPAEAEKVVQGFVQRVSESASSGELLRMLACVRGGRRAVDWATAAADEPVEALRTAKMLAAGGAFPGCGEDGFAAVFNDDSATLGNKWGAFLGLQGLLAAEGRISDLKALVDSAVAAGLTDAPLLYLLDDLADVAVTPEASAVAARIAPSDPAQAPPLILWLLGNWHAARGDRALAGRMRAALADRAAATGDSFVTRSSQALAVGLGIGAGDTAAAITDLRRLLGFGRRENLAWTLAPPMAPARLLLARLLLATGRPAEAIAVAGALDHREPSTFLPFVPASLELRYQAARQLGRRADARRFAERLEALGHSVPSPAPTPEAP